MRNDYPSRTGATPQITSRRDPVLYDSQWQNCPYGEDAARQFDEQGFCFFPELFSSEEVAALNREMQHIRQDKTLRQHEEVITEPGADDCVRTVFDIHLFSAAFGAVANDSRILDFVHFILNDDVYLHQSRLNYKPGFRGREFYWHSDFETWHVEDGMPRMRAVSVVLALRENFATNGPMLLVPGSHRQFVGCPGVTPRDHYKQSLKEQYFGTPDDKVLTDLISQCGIYSVTGPPGSVLFFDCNLMHGSSSNITPHPRSNAFFVFNAVSNRLVQPFGATVPRPEFIAHRQG